MWHSGGDRRRGAGSNASSQPPTRRRAEHGKARMIAPAPRAHHAEVAGAGPIQKFKEHGRGHTAAAAHLLWAVRAPGVVRVGSCGCLRRVGHPRARRRRSHRHIVDPQPKVSLSRRLRHFRAPCVRAPARGRTAIEKRAPQWLGESQALGHCGARSGRTDRPRPAVPTRGAV